MKKYMFFWVLIFGFLCFEYWALTFQPSQSLLLKLQAAGYIHTASPLSTKPGRELSLWLGYIGFGLMVLMNIYSIRKRAGFMQHWGKLSSWLNFHVFCGLVGPTLILFHCDLKVRGIVGISFWSMVISLTSGIIGRYFYVQLLQVKSDYEKLAEEYLLKLDKSLEEKSIPVEANYKMKVLNFSLQYVGGYPGASYVNPIMALFSSMVGDIRISFGQLPTPAAWPKSTQIYLTTYALNKRKSQFLEPFQRLMGYWHAFHFPFAVFMYIAAVIHIISSLVFLGMH
jgi:hypothetical protein